MKHFSPAEFVEAADNALPRARAAHLTGCARCRARLADVQATLARAQAADVPEPSPLYWQHMAARVRERVAHETIVPAWRAASWREWVSVRALVPVASAGAVIAAVIVAGQMTARPPVPLPPATVAPAGPAAGDVSIEPEDSEVWQVLTSAAAEMPIEDAHEAGMGVTAGAIDRAVQRMSPAELNELGHLLQSQLHGSGD
jgi:hypothetical protein